MSDNRTVVEVAAPPEPLFPGPAIIGAVLFPIFALVALALGFIYGMAWLITSSLAISLALLAIVASGYLNKRGRSGQLRLELSYGATRIGPHPTARWLPLIATGLAAVVVLVDIVLRLTGHIVDDGGMSFSIMVGLVVAWGLADGWYGLTKPPGLLLTPRHVTVTAGMGKETQVPWQEINGEAQIRGARLLIPAAKGELQVGLTQIDSDPRVVAALVEAYRNRPARQSELGDGRVVERARTLRIR